MEEFNEITKKYQPAYIGEGLSSLPKLKAFAFVFYKDVSELYDCLTRLKNAERNPSGFSLEDAPILGLLVRIVKLLKEVVVYYEKDNAEIIGILERPIIEAATIASYLMTQGPAALLDYRKCSYKDRLRILRDLEAGSAFYETKAGKRLLRSVREKMAIEGFSKNDFGEQKKNKMATSRKDVLRYLFGGPTCRSLRIDVRHDVRLDPRVLERVFGLVPSSSTRRDLQAEPFFLSRRCPLSSAHSLVHERTVPSMGEKDRCLRRQHPQPSGLDREGERYDIPRLRYDVRRVIGVSPGRPPAQRAKALRESPRRRQKI